MQNKPILLFVSGFLGIPEDWDLVMDDLKRDYPCHALELSESIEEAIASFPLEKTVLIGYSMGGRIALSFQDRAADLIILSSHFGLSSDDEKLKRWEQDLKWIEKLKTVSMDQFLEEWYAQPLFASLKEKKELFALLIKRRKNQDPQHLISLLNRFSLAHQNLSVPNRGLFLSGKEDLKYTALYRTLPPSCHHLTIEGAGHALHIERPKECAAAIRSYLERSQNVHRHQVS
jgi:2-succinyl-6-hydroxy-2,4-cyclohexadiene-1-carboxylate synthase